MKYEETYPSLPMLDSRGLSSPIASELLNLDYFQAEPGEMPLTVYREHHVLINLRNRKQRVEHQRGDKCHEFLYKKHEIVITPAGLLNSWRWHGTSNVIVITINPSGLSDFAAAHLGFRLSERGLRDVLCLPDESLANCAVELRDTVHAENGATVLYESLARIFLVKLLTNYADMDGPTHESAHRLTQGQWRKVYGYIEKHYSDSLTIERLAAELSLSPSHFSRSFKNLLNITPYQYLMTFRVEKAKERLIDAQLSLSEIAYACGFTDQAHFSRVFKRLTGTSPGVWKTR